MSPTDGVQDIILDFFISRGCEQFVRAPTRLNNILDVLLTDSPNPLGNSDHCMEVINPLGNSDHCMVRFNVSVKCEESCGPSPDSLRYLWRDADYTGIANYFNTVNWFNMLTTNLTLDSLWGAFTDTQKRVQYKTLFLLFLYVTSRVGALKIKQHIRKKYVMQCLGNTVYGNVTAKTH